MDRAAYNECMSSYMKGEGRSKEERQQAMCIGAKLCTGKASNQAEAEDICSRPKPPPEPGQSPKKKTRRRRFNAAELAVCIIEKLEGPPTNASLAAAINSCQEGFEVYGKKQFLRDCIKQDAITGSMQELAKLRKQCEVRWNDQDGNAEEG